MTCIQMDSAALASGAEFEAYVAGAGITFFCYYESKPFRRRHGIRPWTQVDRFTEEELAATWRKRRVVTCPSDAGP